ncbi:MAG TPA: PDZ domain-containing protein [Candidatus Acidoferrales bacterium]|nr:PDZ domain-containing protein [Candidatus Acidoferrales bacterium]
MASMRWVGVCGVLAALLAAGPARAGQGPAQQTPEGRLMRFPDISRDQIVFSYGGDLWLAARTGGVARRITTDPGLELFPKFSPDGRWIAFTAQYDGNFNVYVMPAAGGPPKQLTFWPDVAPIPERMGPTNEVIAWTPDSKAIVFLSRHDTFNDWFGRLWKVSVTGGLPEELPLFRGGLTSYSADGTKIAYNPIFRNFRTWKRYRGGLAQEILIYDLAQNTFERVPHTDATDTFPMWHGNTIYFASDRGADERMNLYGYDIGSHQVRQLTHFTDFDVEWPSLGTDAIIFENGGYLYTYELASGKQTKLTIELPGDRPLARPEWKNVAPWITTLDLAPDGKRAVMEARGDAFTVPAEHGSIRNLTRTPGAWERDVTWSPDGKWIAYLSDRTGEYEAYVTAQDGMSPERRITFDGSMFRYQPVWSPDSTKLLYSDKDLRLWYVDINDRKPVQIDQARYGEITDYCWSPDSRWVAYSKPEENTYGAIELYSLDTKKIAPVTTSFTNSWRPIFDPEGKYLYFLSTRDYNEVFGVYDAEFANPKATRVYVVTLRADEPSPFAPESDEVSVKAATAPQGEAGKPAAAKSEKPAPFRIDLDGIGNRIVALPMPVTNVDQLGAGKGMVYYSTVPVAGLDGPLPGETPEIHAYDLGQRKDSVLLAGTSSFTVSFDGKKLLYAAPPAAPPPPGTPATGTYGILDTAPTAAPHHVGDGRLDLSGMTAEIDPPAEWREMYFDAWRQERDFFYSKSMNGVDWAKIRDKYAALLPYVADRYDLTYLIGEIIGELANSHTYTGGGDSPSLHRVNVGMLGADFELDAASGRYRLKKIFPGQNWDPALASPLTEPGVNVKAGDYLLAVNGQDLRAPENPYALFVNTTNQNVTLTVNSQPTPEGARQVVVRPIASELGLRELDWIATNREKVDKATGGRVGYVYLPDMEGHGLDEFVRQYFPQIRKEGLIFDVRYNGGGFVDQMILERLRRILAGMQAARNWAPGTVPDVVFNGALAAITNHFAASDGDIFTYYFKFYKLGPVIGTRTWGGVRGIRGNIPLMDGGYVTRPEFALYGLNSQWIVENHGVEPDIVVENTPDLVRQGHDPQLEKAIQVVMQEIAQHPKRLPPRPPDLPAYPKGPGE